MWWRWNDGGLALSVGVSVFAACSTATLAAMMFPWLFDAFAEYEVARAAPAQERFFAPPMLERQIWAWPSDADRRGNCPGDDTSRT